MDLTGQPMVDVGFAIAALMQDKQSVADVDTQDLRDAVKWLSEHIYPTGSQVGAVNKLKVLTAYWQNNPLMGKNMGTNLENVPKYRSVLDEAAEPKPKKLRGYCQICGQNAVYLDANRSWFPLGASSDGDPCSLPGLGGKFICATCFGAIVLLPIGCLFVGSNPYLFHLNDPQLICQAAKVGWQTIQLQIAAKANGNNALKASVKLTGRLGLLEVVSGSQLWDANQGGILTRHASCGATIIAFNNSGTSPTWYQMHLPAQALDFFAELNKADLRKTFLQWAEPCSKRSYADKTTKEKRPNPLFEQLCEDIEQRQTVAPLLRNIVRGREPAKRRLTEKEKVVLEIYEDIALDKANRFQLLERIATRINAMETRYRDSFVKRLANLRRKENLLDMLREYAHSEKTALRLHRDEIRLLEAEKSNEIISLLYLLCVAEEEHEGNK